jgi:beta-galactosidase
MPLQRHVFAVVAAILVLVAEAAPQTQRRFVVDDRDMMAVGVYYYPEAWPRDQWARDIANIKRLGFEFVHMAEFAWALMEPRNGVFDFGWLDEAIRLAQASGLRVVLCTPSATPPVWLTRLHPEILMVDARGRRMNHGARAHATWSSPVYRKYVERVVDALGKRYGNDPAVWGWQIDNELSHYGREYSYTDADRQAFRRWLVKRYGTVQRLNTAWGNTFWSQVYGDFAEIDIPNRDELAALPNEHALLDFQRWFTEEAADYIRFQAGILRRHTRTQWVTTNFMHLHKEVSPPQSARDLDIVTWTIYPAHGNLNEGPLGFRLGDGTAMSFKGDFARSVNGQHGVMELQPGQVNWGEVNPQPYPGAVRNWIFRTFALGSKLLCTYRYRQPLFGNEQYHHGIVGTDGVTLSRGGEEWVGAMRDLRRLRELGPAGTAEPAAYAARRAALLYSVDNRFDLDNHSQTVRWNTMGHLLKYQRALKGLGAPVDVIGEDKDFSKYRFLVAPAYQLVDRALVERWTEYARQGGHLILSVRTGTKDRQGHFWEGPWAAPLLDLIGSAIEMYDVLPAPHNGRVRTSLTGQSYEWGVWGDVLAPREGTTAIAQYEDQFYAGRSAAVTRPLGKGSVTYVGVETLSGDLEKAIVRRVFSQSGVAVEDYPGQFFVDWRDGFWIASNFSSTPQPAPIPPDVTPIVGERTLPPGGVAIWRAP